MTVNVTPEEIARARRVDIIPMLEKNGIQVGQRGKVAMCSSPFSSDSTPSFVVYMDQNRFHDFSTGNGGDVISLAQLLLDVSFQEAVNTLNGTEAPLWDKKNFDRYRRDKKIFVLENYIVKEKEDIKKIDDYAQSRGITSHYERGFYFTNGGNNVWNKNLAIMFPHTDYDGNVTGAKFRNIDRTSKERFTARGLLGYYTLDNLYWATFDTYIVEGEANANSLYEFFNRREENARVISFGAVGQIPKDINNSKSGRTFIVIDYDGDEKLYQERLKGYDHLNGEDIRLELPKGEDINSLWSRGDHDKLIEVFL